MINIKEHEIKSDLADVKLMAANFQRFCKLNQIDEVLTNRLELALVEALNNIIIHALSNSKKHKINAKFELIDADLSITLTDYGKEFTSKDNNFTESHNTEELSEGNWGLSIIDSISDEVIRNRKNNQNILIIKKMINTK